MSSSIKKLAGQTVWYGISSIAARFINLLLTPLLTYNLAEISDYGKVGLIYAAIPLLNTLFTYGFETAYFRFAGNQLHKKDIYNTSFLSLLFSTIFFTAVLYVFRDSFATVTGLSSVPAVIKISIFIVAIDALTRIPLARLRQEQRPRKYAFVQIGGICMNVFVTWFYIAWCPKHYDANDTFLSVVYDPGTNPVVYVMLANLLQSAFTLLLLIKEVRMVRFSFNFTLWKQMIIYSLPLIIAGMGGMINETVDRLMINWWVPGTPKFKEEQVGIYNACYKLSILITLFVQAFRLGAEPFFFQQAEAGNPQKTYARVMKFFVITICLVFLVVTLFIPIWRYFIKPTYWEGLTIVPILVLANMFLGIYYNLSIWYKITNRTMAGATITIAGVLVTFVINWLFIPRFGYIASAWATFFCYLTMMLISYFWGQKAFFVPYAWKKLTGYIGVVVLLYFVHQGIVSFWPNDFFSLFLGLIFTLSFLFFILKVEKREFSQLPYIGRLLERI